MPPISPNRPWPKPNYFGRDSKGRLCLFITVELPPSDNKLYWVNQWGKFVLSTLGRNYKRIICDVIARTLSSSIGKGDDFRQDIPYELFIALYFEKLEYPNWEQAKKSRFLKIDTGNRQKLVIDSIMEAIGIDDRHIFQELIKKSVDQNQPRIEILLREKPEDSEISSGTTRTGG